MKIDDQMLLKTYDDNWLKFDRKLKSMEMLIEVVISGS